MSQYQENIIQVQAQEIERMTGWGPFGFFQRRRLTRMMQGDQLRRRIHEDELRASIIQLKERINNLTQEVADLRGQR